MPGPRDVLRWLLTPPSRRNTIVGAVTSWQVGRDRIIPQVATWQTEVWTYYDELGEFGYGVQWLASMISRLRLYAGLESPGGNEPEAVDAGPALELVDSLAGGIAGQAQLLEQVATYLSVPGECWIIGETDRGASQWQVRSAEEIRRGPGTRSSVGGAAGVQVIDENSTPDRLNWRDLAPDSLVVRAWRPHKRFRYLADSPARHARSIMREVELVNRRIAAEYLSRLASAGVVVFPSEVQFPVREEFQDEDDPFVKEWVTIAADAIANPGTASAVVPMPIRVPAEYVDKVKHIDFTLAADRELLPKRESALRRLATALDMPAEVLLGMGDVNHWSAWQLEESGIKVHIAPLAELICHALTEGYLRAMLKGVGSASIKAAYAELARRLDYALDALATGYAVNPTVETLRRLNESDEALAARLQRSRHFAATAPADPNKYVVWYDASEITVRPDRSGDAFQAWDRFEITGEALRRETGFDEGDKPEGNELKQQILKRMAAQPATSDEALFLLGLRPATVVESAPASGAPTPTGGGGAEAPNPPAGEEAGPPPTRGAPPPPPDANLPATAHVLRWRCRVCRSFVAPSVLVPGNGHGWVPSAGCAYCGSRLAPELESDEDSRPVAARAR